MPSEQRAGLESSIPPPKPIPAVQHFNDFARLDQSAPKNDLASPRKEDELDPVRILVKRPMKLSELERYAIEAALRKRDPCHAAAGHRPHDAVSQAEKIRPALSDRRSGRVTDARPWVA
jgi:hypothetical protein